MKPQIYPAFLFTVLLLALASVVAPVTSYAQSITVISKRKIYRQQVLQDSNNTMVELRSVLPHVVYDLRYATPHNFTGHVLYKEGNNTFLRLPAARALARVMDDLAKQDLHLKVFDAYRPYSVTRKMWALIKDERYVANPAKGSGHNRGIAVDLTILDHSGKELDMGTAYDNFTDSAHHTFTSLSPAATKNRTLLKTTMERHGFKALETEWWHYSVPGSATYDVLDIPFKKLRK
ncbi:MAG TPA: M15 family metallopeptidase [Flavisolibacter sp.]|nr:M15 family metallopeptidase [Flavisolibacter sp.]